MVKRVKGHGLPFDLLACDALYGRDSQFRADVDAEGVRYAAQVPADTLVYLSEPHVGLPPKRGKRGRPPTRLQVLEFIPIKSLAATGSDAPGSCAGHSTVPSRDRGRPPSTGGSGLSQCDNASRCC